MSVVVELCGGPLGGMVLVVDGDALPPLLCFAPPVSVAEVGRQVRLALADPAIAGTVPLETVAYERDRERGATRSAWRYVYRAAS